MGLGGLAGLFGRGAAATAGRAGSSGGLLGGLSNLVGGVPIVGGLAKKAVQTATSPFGAGLAGGALGGGLLDPVTGLLQEVPIVGGLFGEDAPQQGVGRPTLYTQVIAKYPNGFVELRSEERGTPRLMSRDVQRMKKTISTIRKVDARLPKKTVRQSPLAQLQQAVVQGAIANALKKD